MIDPKRREMFTDLYRLAEYYENPPFAPGDVDGNAKWFITAMHEALYPFFDKHPGKMAIDLAIAILEDASRKAAEMNKKESIL